MTLPATQLKASEELRDWVAEYLNGLKLPRLPHDKRVQLGCGAWHVGIEHHQAIVQLVGSQLHASALALIRPMLDAYVRGLWLIYAATDDDVDNAWRDVIPNDINRLLGDLAKAEQSPHKELAVLKSQWWKRLCSFTHTGYHQIAMRLTAEGLGYDYSDEEIVKALAWADLLVTWILNGFARVAENEALSEALHHRLVAHIRATGGDVD